jgi:hypothetical protein
MMKSIQKITRVKLNIDQNYDFILFGLVSADPDYKVSLTLNKKFRISLKNISPIKLTDETGSDLTFSRFSDTSNSPDLIFNLISNRSGKNFLLKMLKNVDFIFQVLNPDNEYNINNMTTGLREIDTVTAVFNLDMNSIKDKNLKYLTQ